VNAAVEIPKRWPLVTQPENRDETTNKDARLVNCYAEKHSDGYVIEKRFGVSLTPVYTLPGGIARGMYRWQLNESQAIIVMGAGSNLYTASVVGFPTPHIQLSAAIPILNGGTLYFSAIPAATPLLMLTSGNIGYYLDATGTLHTITDTNYPGVTVPGIVYLDGTLYVMSATGNIVNTLNQDDPTVWDPLGIIVAQDEPDVAVALVKQLVYVVALKQWTTQFFYDAGNVTGSPLAPVPGAILPYGCLSADSVQEIDGLILWITSSKTLSPQVLLLESLQMKIVSTPAIDRLLELFTVSVSSNPLQIHSFAFKHAGHRFYGVTVRTPTPITLIYDIDQKLWLQWTDYLGGYYPYFSPTLNLTASNSGISIGSIFTNRIVQHWLTGNVYNIDADFVFPNDAGNIFPVDIYTPNFDGGVDRRKQLNVMRFNADQTTGSELFVRSSNDDYQTWTNFRRVDLGNKRPTLTNCGSFYRRAYHFRHFANTKLRIKSVDLQMDVGTL
jgi:hypothetical protein